MADQARALMNSIQRLLSILRISQKLTQKSIATATKETTASSTSRPTGASWMIVLTSSQEIALKTMAAPTPSSTGFLRRRMLPASR